MQSGWGQAWDPATVAALLLGGSPTAGAGLRFVWSPEQSIWRIQRAWARVLSTQHGVSRRA